MPKNMSISVNGQSQVPPGFRFHPTEEELLQYYLRKKVSYEKTDLDVIREVDLNKLEPWDIQETCKIGSTPQNDWYFFSHKDKKYPTGTRTNRATTVGFWKATGRDKVIYSNGKRIGMRKTLVFYTGRAPHGQKSDWIMHEYRLDNNNLTANALNVSNNDVIGDAVQEDGWVVCRIFKKKNLLKSPLPLASSVAREYGRNNLLTTRDEGDIEQILEQMGSTGYTENEQNEINGGRSTMGFDNKDYEYTFSKLPSLGSPISMSMRASSSQSTVIGGGSGSGLTNWVTLDRLVASQLNGHSDEAFRELGCLFYEERNLQSPTFQSSPTTRSDGKDDTYITPTHAQDHTSDIDLIWSFATSASAFYMTTSESLCHVSNTSL